MAQASSPQPSEISRLAHNAAWSLVGFTVPTLVMAIAIPVYLYFLRVEEYGVLAVSNSLIGFAGVLTLGMGQAATKHVAESAAKRRPEEIAPLLYAALLLYAPVGVVGSLGLWLAAPVMGVALLDLTGRQLAAAVEALRLAAIGFLPAATFWLVTGTLEGLQNFRAAQSLVMARSVATFAVGLGVLVAGARLIGLVASGVVVSWVASVVGLAAVLRGLPRSATSVEEIRAALRRMLSFGVYTALITMGTTAIGQLDKVLVASLAGVEAVSYYAVAQSLSSKVHLFAAAIVRVLMPFFSARAVTAGVGGLSGPLLRSWRASVLLTAATVTLAFGTAPWLLRLWVGDEFGSRALTAYLLLLAAYGLHGFNIVPHFYLLGRGKAAVVAWPTLLGGGLMLLVMAIVTPFWKLTGAAASSLLFPLVNGLISIVVIRAHRLAAESGGIQCGLAPLLLAHSVTAALALGVGHTLSSLWTSNVVGLLASLGVVVMALLLAYTLLQRAGNMYLAAVWHIGGRILRSWSQA